MDKTISFGIYFFGKCFLLVSNHAKHALFKKCVYLVLVIFGSLSKNPKINVSHSFIAYGIF